MARSERRKRPRRFPVHRPFKWTDVHTQEWDAAYIAFMKRHGYRITEDGHLVKIKILPTLNAPVERPKSKKPSA